MLGNRDSENVVAYGVQRLLRQDLEDILSGRAEFWYGSSTSSQQMETWWSQFRRTKENWWIRFFKDVVGFGIYNNSNNYHKEMLRYCFMSILQNKVDEMKKI